MGRARKALPPLTSKQQLSMPSMAELEKQWKAGELNAADYCRGHTREAVDTLLGIMRDTRINPNARTVAATVILDRGWGKPKQEVTGQVEQQVVVQVITGLLRTHDKPPGGGGGG